MLSLGRSIQRTGRGRVGVRHASKWNPMNWGKGSSKVDMYETPEESEEMKSYQQEINTLEQEVREEYLESRRNKSRLSASDRQELHGKPPNVGVTFLYNNMQMKKKFRREMFGRYGAKSTGITPGELWPSQEDLKLAKEWEGLYQPSPLRQMIDDAKKVDEDLKQKRLDRENKIEQNLVRHESQLAAWKNRMKAKEMLAQGEKNRRAKILAELKDEFGYDVNPEDEIMKTKIEEREKVLIKEERELKKKLRQEREAQKA